VAFQQLNKVIADTAAQIDDETRRMEADTQAKRDAVRARLDAADGALREAEERLRAVNAQIVARKEEADAVREEGRGLADAKARLQREIEGLEEQIARARDAVSHRLAPYGRGVDALVERVRQARWHGEVPVGPFGAHVRVREPEMWAALMRVQLGNLMFRFAITDARDRPALQKMLRDSGK
jgi:structural maintenance of chromosomes protein 6